MIFRNEPFTDFSNVEHQSAMARALFDVRSQLGKTYPLMLNGRRVKTRKTFQSINPSHPLEVVGIVPAAERRHALQALEIATRAFESWKKISQDQRADVLKRMAAILRRRKFEFNAWLVFEVGKSWAEADADTAEAIDFLEYYAELSLVPPPVLTPVASEDNRYVHQPLGPVVVIPPWNFPLAIAVGMTVAAVVVGNTVILKPSSQSPIIAFKWMEIVEEAGLPAGVITLLPGEGSHIGDVLVSDPRTRMIAFTGSKDVGLHLQTVAAQSLKGQRWIKRVIAELGGKNAIIVDASSNLDDAVQGVAASAFGYQGQKCSACSRVYIDRTIYNSFVERFLEKVSGLRIGPADVKDHTFGPVISPSSQKRIQGFITCGKKHGRVLTSSPSLPSEGYYVAPTVLDRLSPTCRVRHEEIFGPVVVLDSVKSIDDAFRQANASDYGLTGSVYSQDASALQKASENFFCGNLYLNRKSTGAMVGGHPFGGFNMSGTDSKAGGPDYLNYFRQGQCISRKF